MPLTVVVGAQFGGEGKGKIVSNLSINDDVDIVVRCGGPNSGHTVDRQGFRVGLRMLPAGFVNEKTQLMLAAGSLVNQRILFDEIKNCNVNPSRLTIDQNACIVLDDYSKDELDRGLRKRISSTASGTGIAVAKRALRDPEVQLVKDVDTLASFAGDVSFRVNQALDEGKTVVVEGTQGYGLSLYHSANYPYCTSRDTTVSGFLSEVGLAPSLVDEVIMAVRTFPIRVEGESGPLTNEISWQELRTKSNYPYPISETTTATGRTRRVGLFDIELVSKAARINRPTQLALHGVDYLSYKDKGQVTFGNLSPQTIKFIDSLEQSLNIPVRFVGTGPKDEEIIFRGNGGQQWELAQHQARRQNQ